MHQSFHSQQRPPPPPPPPTPLPPEFCSCHPRHLTSENLLIPILLLSGPFCLLYFFIIKFLRCLADPVPNVFPTLFLGFFPAKRRHFLWASLLHLGFSLHPPQLFTCRTAFLFLFLSPFFWKHVPLPPPPAIPLPPMRNLILVTFFSFFVFPYFSGGSQLTVLIPPPNSDFFPFIFFSAPSQGPSQRF